MAPSFRAFIPVPSIHGTNGGKPAVGAPLGNALRFILGRPPLNTARPGHRSMRSVLSKLRRS